MRNFRDRLSYANVTATAALFIALGGTGYAAMKLPRNSVGSAQLRKEAVKSRAIKNGGIKGTDLSRSTRQSLGGFHAAVNSAGGLVRGNATAAANAAGDGVYTLRWRRDVSRCEAAASLASVPGGPVVDPPGGSATLRYVSPGLQVNTFDAAGTPTDLPFTVVVAC